MNEGFLADIPVTALRAHPQNPRLQPRQDIIDQIAARITDGIDQMHALIVRYDAEGNHEIISGHHRWMAAQQVGLETVPCWVRDMDDAEAYMQLVLCNTQSELHPLEEGRHAAESGMDLKAYAAQAGKARQSLQHKVYAWRVVSSVPAGGHDVVRDAWSNLAEIHAAPRWLWAALADAMLGSGWTRAQTRARVAAHKGIDPPGAPFNEPVISIVLVDGAMKAGEIARMRDAIDTAAVTDPDLVDSLHAALADKPPSRLSDVQTIVLEIEAQQEERNRARRQAELDAQKAAETAAQRVANRRKNCSLDEWKDLTDDERQALLTPIAGEGGTFNAQENKAIEWAQWSWNPVTGCRHTCPYCYARDIALSPRMQKPGLYPNGFEPTFRSNALNAPANTKVPKQAAHDTRHRNVFTCSMADLFGRWVPIEWIDAVMATVRDSPEWNFLFLTKFPQRLKEVEIPDNAWMGTTVDLQARVSNAEKAFETVTGKVKWLSVEPLIEPLRFERLDLFDWLVIGGASRSDRTPEWIPPYRWVDDLVRQADAAGVPVYMKTNIGITNRLMQLPFDAPITQPPQAAPAEFHYLGAKDRD